MNDRRQLGVRIIQYEQTSPDEVDLDWWVDCFGEKTDRAARREWVISCILSDRIEGAVYDLLLDWLTRGQVTLAEIPVSP